MKLDVEIKRYFPQAISFELAEKLSAKRLLTFYKKYRYILLQSEPESKFGRVNEEYPIIKGYFEKLKEVLSSKEHVVK
jgi:uncharacterized protein YbgA (DUF1722 family)